MLKKATFSFFLSIGLVLGITQPISTAAISGSISTLGVPGYARTFALPTDLAELSDGSLLILDQAKFEIYRLNGNTLSSFATFARRYNSYYSGDEPCALDVNKANEVFVVNCSQTKLFKLDSRGVIQRTFTIPNLGVTDRGFDWGGGLAVDSRSNVFLSDEKNQQILRFDSRNESFEVYAGVQGVNGKTNGAKLQATFNLPRGLAVDINDNLYVADTLSRRIRKIDTQGQVSDFGQDICQPIGVGFDRLGNLVVASEYFCGAKITKISPIGANSTLVDDSASTTGPVAYSLVSKPLFGIAAAAGVEVVTQGSGGQELIAITDGKNGSIKFLDGSGSISRVFGSRDVFGVNTSSTQSPYFNYPHTIFALTDGTNLVVDNSTIRLISGDGRVLRFAHIPGGCLTNAALWDDGTLFCRQGRFITVRFTDGTTMDIGSRASGGFQDGDSSAARFDVVDGLSFYGNKIYASDLGNHAVRVITRGSSARSFRVSTLVSGMSTVRQDFAVSKSAATFSYPSQIGESPDGSIYIAEGGWDRLRRLDPAGAGVVSNVAGNFKSWPTGIVVDGKERVFISTERGFIYEVEANSLVRVGGDGPGLEETSLSAAKFHRPHGMAIDGNGDLLFADSENNVIRKVSGLNLTPNLIYSPQKLQALFAGMKQTSQPSSSNNSVTKPQAPRFSGVNIVGNTLNINVNVGTGSQRPDKVYLVAPRLGATQSNPIQGKVTDGNATWAVQLDKALSGLMIPLEFVSERDGVKSEAETASFKVPNFQGEAIKSAPPRPKNFKARIVGSTAVITVDIETKASSLAAKSHLFSDALGISKSKSISGELIGNKAAFEIPIKASMAGKRYALSIYLSNSKGDSPITTGTLSVPNVKRPVIPNVNQLPQTPSNVICTRANQTRTFLGAKCPPGWEKA